MIRLFFKHAIKLFRRYKSFEFCRSKIYANYLCQHLRCNVINFFIRAIYSSALDSKGNRSLHELRMERAREGGDEKISFRHELELLFRSCRYRSVTLPRGQQHFYRRSDIFATPRANCLANRKISDKIFAVETESRD